MTGKDRPYNPNTLYVALHRAEIEAQVAEIRRAQQAVAGRRLRHRVGRALIALGETLSERCPDPTPAEPAVGKGW